MLINEQKAKAGNEGDGEGKRVQRENLRQGEKCRAFVGFYRSPPAYGCLFA